MIQSAGIALVVKSLLGTSPISSLPYVLSLISPFTFGQTTFAVNMVFVVFELLMLRRDFPAVFWLQIPVTILFGFCIDFFMALFAIVPEAYALKLLLCLLGTSLVALGVAGQGIADVLMLAGEGAVYVFARKFHIDFGKVKVGNDISLVILAAIVSVLTMDGHHRGHPRGHADLCTLDRHHRPLLPAPSEPHRRPRPHLPRAA